MVLVRFGVIKGIKSSVEIDSRKGGLMALISNRSWTSVCSGVFGLGPAVALGFGLTRGVPQPENDCLCRLTTLGRAPTFGLGVFDLTTAVSACDSCVFTLAKMLDFSAVWGLGVLERLDSGG